MAVVSRPATAACDVYSALLRCHHVDMRRHNGNLLAPTFGALGLRCPMLRNCLGTFERQ